MQPRFSDFRPIQRPFIAGPEPKKHELFGKVHPLQHHRAALRIPNLSWRIRHSQ